MTSLSLLADRTVVYAVYILLPIDVPVEGWFSCSVSNICLSPVGYSIKLIDGKTAYLLIALAYSGTGITV